MSDTYDFYLKDGQTGRYDKNAVISLPRVTRIIGAILAKPYLIEWYYRQTRDSVAGMMDVYYHEFDDPHFTSEDLLEELTDAEDLDELLKQNRMRQMDLRDERRDEGIAAHTFLQHLAERQLEAGEEAAYTLAERMLDNSVADGFQIATANWWLEEKPWVIATEQVLYSLKHRYAGRCDLVRASGITDLKTRKLEAGMYESDDIQTAAYKVAWEEMGGTCNSRSVLVIREDGTYDEYPCVLPDEAWLHIRELYRLLRGV